MTDARAVYDGNDSIYLIGGTNTFSILKYSLSSSSVHAVGRFDSTMSPGAVFMNRDEIIQFGGCRTRCLYGIQSLELRTRLEV